MPIELNCRKCGEQYRVSDSRAGASFKCRECGAPNTVPTPKNPSPSKRSSSRQASRRSARRQEFNDDYEYDDSEMEYEEYDSPTSSNRSRQRRGRSEVTGNSLPIVQYSITGSIIIAVYFVVYMVLDTALAKTTVNEWVLPEVHKNGLGPEVAILQYGIRPPTGLAFAGHEDGGIHRDWAWAGNGQSLTVSVRSNPRIAQHGLTEPEIHTTNDSFQSSRPEGDQPYLLDGGTVEHGTIDGVKFTRARWDMQGGTMFMGPAVTHDYRYFTDYITYDGINRIDVVFSSQQPFSSTDVAALEASAFTLRRLPANSNVTPPGLDQPGASTESGTLPARNIGEVAEQPILPNVKRVTSSAETASDATLPGSSGFGTQLASSASAPERAELRTVSSKVTPPSISNSQPESAVAWGNNSGTNIPIKNWATPVTYSPAPSKYVAVENTIFNLTSGVPVLALPDYNCRAATFSPSGAKYAVVNARGSDWEGNIVVHSVEQPDAEAIELVLDDRPYRYEVLRFLAESRLFVFGRDAEGKRTAAIWDLESLQVERRLDISTGDQGACAVSKDGTFIAMASATELKVYSSQSGQKVAQMEKPQKIEGLPFAFCNGLAFSPDMQELAAFTMGKHVTVWSKRGKVVFECELSEKLAAHVKSEQGIIWMPDSSGWLLQGEFLLLKDGPTEGWWLKSERPYEAVPGTLTTDNRAVGAKGSASGGFLTAVEIPISAIRATVDAANKVPPLISEGDSISLDLEIESLRFATDGEARQALTEAFAARLKRGNIGISTGSKVSLQIRYRETPGKERRIVKGPFAVFTQEKGIKAQDTNCVVEMSLVSSDRPEPLWSNKIESDAGILIDEEPNDKGLRNSAFGSPILRIRQLDLPLRVSGDPNASLPVITRP